MAWQRFGCLLVFILAIMLGCQGGGGGTPAAPDTTNGSPDTSNGNPDLDRIEIEAGEFIRGYNDLQNFPDEFPADDINLDRYFISKTEVTNRQFAEFLNAENEVHFSGDMYIQNVSGVFTANTNFEEHPVVWVDYEGAVAYAEWKGGRLPTEAEWEKAARGKYGINYPWGDIAEDNKADVGRPYDENTIRVGSYPNGTSPYGVLDMAGSVWEWCHDWYYHYYYSHQPVVTENPTGPEEPIYGIVRSIRGASFREYIIESRCSNRYWTEPATRTFNLGFRIVWDE